MTPIETVTADYGPEHLVTQITHWLTEIQKRVGEKYFSSIPVATKFDKHPVKDIHRALFYLASDRVQLLKVILTDGQERVLCVDEARKAIVDTPETTCVWFQFITPETGESEVERNG